MNFVKSKLNMKSKIFLSIYLGVTIFLLIFSIVSMNVSSYNNSPREKIDTQQFISYIENKGCKLDNYLEESNESLTFYQVTDNSCPYTIGYLISKDNDKLKTYYESLKKRAIETQNLYVYNYVNTASYKEYVTDGDLYNVVSMYDDSILYLSVNSEYKETAIEIRKELGYYQSSDLYIWSLVLTLSIFLFLILILISWWKLNVKFGRKGWICLIPMYNVLCLGQDLFGKKLYGVFLLIPVINFIFIVIFCYRIGKMFGKKTSVCILTAILPQIFIPITAFDDSKYIGYLK